MVAKPFTGTINIDIRDSEPDWIKTQPGKFAIGGEGLCVGRDRGEAVTDDYPGTAPWRFTGGTIRRVQVYVSGKPYIDLEREAVAMMSRE